MILLQQPLPWMPFSCWDMLFTIGNESSFIPDSPIAEYGESLSATSSQSNSSKLSSSKRFAKVPMLQTSGQWGGFLITFIATDFMFWDTNMCQLDKLICLAHDAGNLIIKIHIIRFRFDKLKHNFTIHKFWQQQLIKFDIISIVNLLSSKHSENSSS
jgi:hypothetical protein